ncbi:polysaccharide biosynthesis C-terminal domain-containing protein [Aerosakkonemataceae cyanobacterium BLCC-F50]|uniref:Polysaccharide biosynthesis C-terminal domain-containing protein n=1 Tax=Floridaenema flaviceps BLCC-F50 TaxID=3153642 RepID=A0ABV4XUM4_9CYAN
MTNLALSQNQKSIQFDLLAKETTIALIIKIIGLSLTYLLQIFLAKWMGRTEYGIYEFVMSCSLLLMTFTEPVLSLFGSGFIAADWSLKVLVFGQLVNALCGSVGYLMIMTGHQNQSFRVIFCSALLNVVLNAILIPFFGIVGAAIATSFTMIVWNVWLSILVVKYIGVRPSILYSFFKRDDLS